MRKLLIGAGAVALLIACSSSGTGDTPPNVGAVGTGGAMTGTGGDMGVPGTGGATGYVGTGGDPMAVATGGALVGTGGDPGVPTGGVSAAPTGGVSAVPTGGVTNVPTGGLSSVATGGLPPIATGGLPPIATGGLPPVGTGGVSAGPTGGVSTANTGGLSIIGNTGGSGNDDTGGTDPGDDDVPADDDDEPVVYPDEFVVNSNGFCTQATLSGYAWTNNEDGFGEGFEAVGDAGELCASDTVSNADPDYHVGMIGWNIGQPSAGGTNQAVELSGSITITYKNAGGTPLRLQIESASEAFCVDLSGTSGSEKTETFPLEDLVAYCWEGGAQEPAYDGEGIKAIQLLAPGEGPDGATLDVDMCLVSVEVSMD